MTTKKQKDKLSRILRREFGLSFTDSKRFGKILCQSYTFSKEIGVKAEELLLCIYSMRDNPIIDKLYYRYFRNSICSYFKVNETEWQFIPIWILRKGMSMTIELPSEEISIV